MSHETSPSTQQPYGIARVTRVWQVPRSTVYARRDRRESMCEGEYTPGGDLVGEAHAAEDQTPQNHDFTAW